MDDNKDADQENRWHLYKDALDGSEYQLEEVHDKELYGDLARVSSKIGIRRMKLAGHARCHEELLLNKLVLWNLLHEQAWRGRPCQTPLDCMKEDTNLHSLEEIDAIMKQ